MKAIASPPALPEFPPAHVAPLPSSENVHIVRDLPQLVERILALKPHDQVEMMLSVKNPQADNHEYCQDPEERGYLMDIRVGPQSNVCVKRTF